LTDLQRIFVELKNEPNAASTSLREGEGQDRWANQVEERARERQEETSETTPSGFLQSLQN
jgi:hypothetical protein